MIDTVAEAATTAQYIANAKYVVLAATPRNVTNAAYWDDVHEQAATCEREANQALPVLAHGLYSLDMPVYNQWYVLRAPVHIGGHWRWLAWRLVVASDGFNRLAVMEVR